MLTRPAAAHSRLVYVVGPSGSGKDSLIDYARARVPPGAGIVFAQRTITRPAGAGGESHLGVTQQAFDARLCAGAFAMHWRAHGLSYGVGREIRDWLAQGRTVVVSGSRAHLPEALAAFADLEVVQIDAALEVLRRRLAARAREAGAAIDARLERGTGLALPEERVALHITNDGALAPAGERLLGFLLYGPGASRPGRV